MERLDPEQDGQAKGISIRLAPSLYDEVMDLAEDIDLPKSNLARELLKGAMESLDEALKNKTEKHLTPALRQIHHLRGRSSMKGGPMKQERKISVSGRVKVLEQDMGDVKNLLHDIKKTLDAGPTIPRPSASSLTDFITGK